MGRKSNQGFRILVLVSVMRYVNSLHMKLNVWNCYLFYVNNLISGFINQMRHAHLPQEKQLPPKSNVEWNFQFTHMTYDIWASSILKNFRNFEYHQTITSNTLIHFQLIELLKSNPFAFKMSLETVPIRRFNCVHKQLNK